MSLHAGLGQEEKLLRGQIIIAKVTLERAQGPRGAERHLQFFALPLGAQMFCLFLISLFPNIIIQDCSWSSNVTGVTTIWCIHVCKGCTSYVS